MRPRGGSSGLFAPTQRRLPDLAQSAAVIPYLHVSDFSLELGSSTLTIRPFGALVMAAIILGVVLTVRRAAKLGLDPILVDSYIWTMLAGAFLGSRFVEATLYHPSGLVGRPWALLWVWEGMSSLGGFLGAVVGGLAWSRLTIGPLRAAGFLRHVPVIRRRPMPIPLLPYADLTSSVFPVAWILGRAGCTLAHDHPGRLAPEGSWWAVAYGPVERLVDLGPVELRWGSTPRYDLGLIELVLTVLFVAALIPTWRRTLPVGTYVLFCCLGYPPVRFVLEFLRAEDLPQSDPRHSGLTAAQWGCIVLFAVGLAVRGRMVNERISRLL